MEYQQHNSEYLQLNPTWHQQDAAWKAQQILQAISSNKIEAKTIAEIGCGSGEILVQLQQNLTDKTIAFSGFDIALDAITIAKPKENSKLQYFTKDPTKLDDRFDVLLIIDVIEHIDDYLGFIKSIKEKATYKIYHIPLDMSALSIITNYPIKARKSVGHLHYFMKETALASIAESQQIQDWFYTHTAFEVNNKKLGFKGSVIQFFRKICYKIKPSLAVKLFGGFSLMVVAK